MTTDLTDRQREVLSTIRSFIVQRYYPPTIREISALLGGISTNAVVCHLNALEKKGAIRLDREAKSRAIVVLDEHGQPWTPASPVRSAVAALLAKARYGTAALDGTPLVTVPLTEFEALAVAADFEPLTEVAG